MNKGGTMESRWIVAISITLLLTFLVGFRVSYVKGIQPGYFEKKEAPAYGVGGGEAFGKDLDKEVQDYFKNLYKEEE